MNITAHVAAVPATPEHGWFYDYQTFVTGVLALLAALIAAEIARRQLNEMRRQADRDRAGRLRAARASLPAVLSAICDHSEVVARALNAAWPTVAVLYPSEVGPLQSYKITVDVPFFPAETLQPLERLVELTDNEPVAERIESILREAQVLGARTRKLAGGDELETHMLSTYVLQAASIYARAESLFEYARRQSNSIAVEPLWARVFAALSIMGVDRAEIVDLARRERDADLSPGEADTRGVY